MKDLKNLSNDTVLRIRVPKALYESISKELKKKKLNENLNESLVDTITQALQNLDADTIGYLATIGGITGAAKILADKIKGSAGSQSSISDITGVKEDLEEELEEINAPDPIDSLLKKQDFVLALKYINTDDRFNKFMNAMWNQIPSSYKPKAIAALKSFYGDKSTAPTSGDKSGMPPVAKKPTAPTGGVPPKLPK